MDDEPLSISDICQRVSAVDLCQFLATSAQHLELEMSPMIFENTLEDLAKQSKHH